ncbi:MAG: hypothetical protein ACREFQ_18265 [Stellaceae bacterium]
MKLLIDRVVAGPRDPQDALRMRRGGGGKAANDKSGDEQIFISSHVAHNSHAMRGS